MKKQVELKIYGQVQGVFFRMHIQRKARALGLVGWVENEDDGSVRVLALGDENKLEELITWCYQGPEFARVDTILKEWSDKREKYNSFEIKY